MLLEDEANDESAFALWGAAERVWVSRIAEPEVRAALAAAARDRRLSLTALQRSKGQLRVLLEQVHIMELTRDIAHHAGDLAERHRLSGFDAIHLASILAVGSQAVVVTFDRRLAAAVMAEGLVLAVSR